MPPDVSTSDRQQLSNAFGELIDAVRAAEQRLVSADPPLDDVELAEGYRWLFSILSVGLDTQVWADTDRPRFVEIVGPHRKWGGDNADAYYHHAPLDPKRTYVVRGRSGDAAYMSLTVYGGPNDGRYSERIVGQINHNDIKFADDGTFEVVLSPSDRVSATNRVTLEPDAVCVITRDYLEDPVRGIRAEWSIEAVDPPATTSVTPAQVGKGFQAATTWLTEQAQMCPLRIDPPNEVQEPYPVPQTTFGWAAGDAAYAMGSFQLGDDQALVIEGTSPECAFWNLCLWNPFLHTFDYRYEQVTINDSQVRYNRDGSWRLVVAAHDPEVPNWLHTQGHRRGLLWFRWFLPETTPARPRCRVVPLAELRRPPGSNPDRELDQEPDREPARITDLDRPQFSPDAWAILNGLAEAGSDLVFTADRLCQTAMDQTGLDRWGDTEFRERLDILCGALTSEGRLSDYGKAATWEGLLQLLRNRLQVEDLFAQFPEIEDVPVAQPIIICGQPRTGTTHLHNLLSADPALRHLPYWESLEPVLPRTEWPDPADPRQGHPGTSPDPRLARTQVAVDVVDLCLPLFKRMHEMTVDHAHEEIELLAIDIAGMSFETTSLLPSWRDQYKATDQTPSYRYLRRVLQALTWLRGGSRWVLKSPQHLEQFQPLLATFPDATFVVTHRDPVAVTVSVCTMLAYAARMRTDRPDLPAITRYWVDRNADLLEACMADHHLLPPDRTIDVRFNDFMADEMGTVEQIYALAGQPLDDQARQAMATYVSTHPRGRHGTVAYEPETLGIDPGPIRERLAPYATRFGVNLSPQSS